MRKLVLTLLALLAFFAALRAYTDSLPVTGLELQPGLVEIGDGTTNVGLAFGTMQKSAGPTSFWDLLPLRLTYTTGSQTVTIGLNGLSFLLRGGVSVGRSVVVSSPRTGDVISVGGKVTIDSRVDGDVWTLGADVELTQRAEVGGNVVALGGKVLTAPKAVVHGSMNQLPELKIPFLGVLGTQLSVQVLGFGKQVLGFVLLGFVMFLSAFYMKRHARSVYQSFGSTWRETLVTLLISLVLIPIFMALLIVSVIGIFFLPIVVFVAALAALDGFLLLCARLGGALRRRDTQTTGNESLYFFTSGLLGLFLVKIPALVGIGISFLSSPAAQKAGTILQVVSLGILFAGFLYGFAACLAHARHAAARAE